MVNGICHLGLGRIPRSSVDPTSAIASLINRNRMALGILEYSCSGRLFTRLRAWMADIFLLKFIPPSLASGVAYPRPSHLVAAL